MVRTNKQLSNLYRNWFLVTVTAWVIIITVFAFYGYEEQATFFTLIPVWLGVEWSKYSNRAKQEQSHENGKS